MVKVRKNRVGMRYGRLTVIEQAEDHITSSGRHYAQWLCQCDCGNHTIVQGGDLTSGHTSSCGCYQAELTKERMTQNNNIYDMNTYEYGVLWINGVGSQMVLFDKEDANLIQKYQWCMGKKYATTCIENNKNVTMHQLIGCKGYDHHDQNPLNNQKNNLVQCTHKENIRNSAMSKNNTSGFIGVSWSKERNKWVASIQIDGKMFSLGRYINQEDAIKARLQAEADYFGEFAPQRHLFEKYQIITKQNDSNKGDKINAKIN